MRLLELGILLIVQILIAVFLYVSNLGGPEAPGAFLNFVPEEVVKIVVDSEDGEVVISKVENRWQLPDGSAADADRIDRVLTGLASANAGWPVGESGASIDRFKVSDDNFEKRVRLESKDGLLEEFFIGSTPGHKKVHARKGNGPVYAINFSTYDLGTKQSVWLNKQLLRPTGEMTTLIRTDGYTMYKGDDDWEVDQDIELDPVKVSSFIGRFTNLSVYDFSDKDLPDTPNAEFTLVDEAGSSRLSVYYLDEDEEWAITSSRAPGIYKLSTYIGEEMTQDLSELSIEESDEDSEEEST